MRRSLLLALLLVAACGGGSSGPAFSPAGRWHGESQALTLDLVLHESGGQVTGTAEFSASTDVGPGGVLALTGTWRHDSLAITIAGAEYQGAPAPFHFAGPKTSANRVDGTWTAGSASGALTLYQQQ